MEKKRKYIRWGVWAAATPFILFAMLCILIYLPPVQNYLVDKATVYASEATGMKIEVGRITLSFPLDLVVKDVKATSQQGDTLLQVERLQVEVQMLPLLRKQVEVDGISLKGAVVDSRNLMTGMTLNGRLGELFISSHGVDFDPETAIINKVWLKDTDISLCLNESAAEDTTATDTLFWKVILQDIDMENVSFALSMPNDSLSFSAALDEASLRDGLIDLHRSAYSLETFRLKNGSISYDSGAASAALPSDSVLVGLDPSHIALTDIGIQLDSLYYEGKRMNALIHELVLKERSGLEIVSVKGHLTSDERELRIPYLRLATPASFLDVEASLDWTALDGNRDAVLSARLMADIGKQDVLLMAGGADKELMAQYPDESLHLHTDLDGDLTHLRLADLRAELPGAMHFLAQGELLHLTDSLRRGGDITLEAEAKNLSFLLAMTDGIDIPTGTRLEGRFTMSGPKMVTDMLLIQPQAVATALTDTVPMTVYDDTLSVADDFRMKHAARVFARYDLSRDAYEADLAVNELDLQQYLPKDSLYTFSTRIKAVGEGIDFLSSRTRLDAEGTIDRFGYGSYNLAGLALSARLEKSVLSAALTAQNSIMDVKAHLDGKLTAQEVTADLNMDIARIDWQLLRLMNVQFETSQHIGVRFSTDLKQRHTLDADMTNTAISTAKRSFRAKDLFVGVATSKDSTNAYLRAGDMDVSMEGKGTVDEIATQADALMTRLSEQWATKTIVQEELRRLLPGLCFKVSSGQDNPIANFLSFKGMNYRRLFMDMDSSPEDGLNGHAFIHGLRTDSLELDSLYLDVKQDTTGIRWTSGVASGAKPRQEAFDVTLDGMVGNGHAEMLVEYLNARKEKGVHLGMKAELRRRGIRMRFFPEQPTLVYRPFTLNKNNFIYLSDSGRIRANVTVHDEAGSGLSFYTNREDTLARQDLTLELSRINMKEFRRILPYMPDMEGWIGADLHYIDSDESLMLSGDLRMDEFKYEGSPLGDWEVNGVYLPGENNEHHVDGFVMHNGEQIAALAGIYQAAAVGTGKLDADMELSHFPLDILNPFIPDRMVEFAGDIDGTLAVRGKPTRPLMNGSLGLDSVSIFMPDLSAKFHFDNEPVQMVDSKMRFRNFDIFTKGNTPFTINGDVDFSNLEKMRMDLKMQARNYELLNAPRTKRAMIYGKMYVDIDATLRGPMDELVMRGNMNVLGKTDFTYVLKDSPLAVNDRLGEMVEFVNFNDTTAVEADTLQTIALTGIDLAMTMRIDQAVQARVDLVPDGSNYMLLEGGGDLSFQYTPQGDMFLTGRYSLISGKMKYEIPIIPLKTLDIRSGSYVEWTGNVMIPQLNIVATERVRASVGEEGKASRMVGFDVGVALTERLENLGLAFTLSAPEDPSVQEQLDAMSTEERGKLAVTMLVTGMYMAEGNSTGGFNVNNALNSFLQNQISNIAGQALDINLGMETVDDGGGGNRTDYNFQFAKRFWNNRFRIVIGGTVSTGSNAQQEETFIDNVSIEYRLDNSGTRYVKLFHDKNYESVLEGEITETGIGVVLRKKMTRLGELFIFRKKKNQQ